MRKLRLGILGTGIATRDLYWPMLKLLKGRIRIQGVANRSREKAEAFAKMASVPKIFSSGEALLESPEIDAVMLSLPIPAIAPWVLRALKSGKPVLSEKPIAATAAEGRRLIQAAKRFSNPWMVGENYFFTPHVMKAKAWIDEGKIGKLRLIEASQINMLSAEGKYYKTAWRRDPNFVGFVIDAGVHIAHMVRDFFGMPVVTGKQHAHFNPLARPIDTAIATLRFKSGALGIWKSCFGAKPSAEIPMLQVYGSLGSVQIFHDYSIWHDLKGKTERFDSKKTGFYGQFLHFADVATGRSKLRFQPSDALLDLELIEKIARQAPGSR